MHERSNLHSGPDSKANLFARIKGPNLKRAQSVVETSELYWLPFMFLG